MLTGLVFRYLAFFAGLLLFFSAQAMEAPRVDGIRWVNASQVEITWSVVDVGMISGYARCNSSERTCAAGMVSAPGLSGMAPYSALRAGRKFTSIRARAWPRWLNVLSVLMVGVASFCVTQIPVITVHTAAAL